MAIVAALFGIVVLVAVAGVVLAGILALRGKAKYDASAQLVPGMASSVPTSWAGSHDPEARLHRRLRDALAALGANQRFDDDGGLLDLRVELQQQAQALDEQLVATAALAPQLKAEPLARIEGGVVAVEQAVADLAGASITDANARLSRALEDVRARTGLVAQAKAALDELPPVPQAAPAPAPPAPLAPDPAATAPSEAQTHPATPPPAAEPGQAPG